MDITTAFYKARDCGGYAKPAGINFAFYYENDTWRMTEIVQLRRRGDPEPPPQKCDNFFEWILRDWEYHESL